MDQPENVCEENVYNKIYNEYGDAIWRFIYFKCGNSAQADDLVQDAFIKLFQNCKKVTPAKAKSYLYTVANNAFLNEVAHSKVVLKHKNQVVSHTNKETPQYLLEEKEFNDKLQNAIANLTDSQRTAFLMNRIDGKKYKEIAEILNISVKAVEKRISKALAELRKNIENI